MKINHLYTVRIAALLMLAGTLAAGCTGIFKELNTHPTDLDPSKMTPVERIASLFPTMIDLLNPDHENDNQHIEQMVGGQYGGYFATTNPWNNTNFGTFNPSGSWVSEPYRILFTDFYSNWFEVAAQTDSNGYLYEWANILRVAVMSRCADIYGPIPYSKMGGGEFQVGYDDLGTLYHELIDQLTESIDFFVLFVQDSGGNVPALADYDTMYSGDFRKWLKYANSLKFRLAVRIASVDREYACRAMSEAMDGGMIEANADNAWLRTNDNPYRKSAEDWGDLAINASFSTYMNGYDDPRAEFMMSRTNDGVYRGVRMGISNINKGTYGESGRFSKPVFKQNSPMPVYYACETAFLKAEAALMGWIDGGESMAEEYYRQGILLSMEQWGASAGAYLSSESVPSSYVDPVAPRHNAEIKGAPCVAWDGAGAKLEKIITQKWLANYPIGIEAWCDFRRTGYPRLITAADNLSDSGSIGDIDSGRMVRRLPYSQDEKDNNPVNLQYAVDNWLGGQDLGNVDLWWAMKSGL